jgi:hypothetical protein
VGQTIELETNVSAPGSTISEVRFFHRNLHIGSDNSPPFTLGYSLPSWGKFSFTAVAIDLNGSFSAASQPINVLVPYDSDSDGLPDWWEMESFGQLGNSFAGDYDSDGLTNAQEFEYDTNPTLADSDGDGVNDAIEIAEGSDPTNPENSSKLAELHIYTRLE